MKNRFTLVLGILVVLVFALAACTTQAEETLSPGLPTELPGPAQTETTAPTSTHTPTLTPSPTPTSTPTLTPSPTSTSSPTPIPTYVKLRGQVNVAHVVCHYGPGQPYLYKYGLVGGSNLEIIRRVEPGTYIEVQAIGGSNPCWVNPQWMDITGDLSQVEPVRPEDVKLPFTPYYSNYLTGVFATRSGDEVTIGWDPFYLKAGDDSEQYPYLLESWVCQGGEIVFIPVGSYQTSVTVTDEAGCDEPSWGRVYAVEKHGYTSWVKVPWPAHKSTPTSPPG